MFITIEGIDGTGKTTQAANIVELITMMMGSGKVLWTREPGGWTKGLLVRELLLHSELKHIHSELYLFLIDRCEHVSGVIMPALQEDKIVVCERYTDSTLAYQVWGRGLPQHKVEDLFAWSGFPVPDKTIWLDMDVSGALSRVRSRGDQDRIESDGVEFLTRVRKGYAELHGREPGRIKRINAEGPVEDVRERVLSEMRPLLEDLR